MFDIGFYLISLLLTVVLIFIFKTQAVRVGLVDRPDARKQHQNSTPLVGGVGIFCGFFISFITLELPVHILWIFFLAALIMIVIGVLDDYYALPFKPRLVAQVVSASVMVFGGGVVLNDLGALTFSDGFFVMGFFAVPLTIFATVGMINALNMSDGLDGLLGSLVFIALVGLAVVAYIGEAYAQLQIVLLLASCMAAFLLFNLRTPLRSRASVFLGDAGSMFLGLALTWLVISLSQGEDRAMSPVTALWLVALPLIDTVSIMLRRILKGNSPFLPDREHFHHVLLLAGFSVSQSVVIMASVAALCAGIGLLGLYLDIPELLMFILFLCLFSLHFWGMKRAWKVMRFLNRSICRRRKILGKKELSFPERRGM